MKRILSALFCSMMVLAVSAAYAEETVQEVDIYGDMTTTTTVTSDPYASSYKSSTSAAVGNYAVKIGPVGNVYTVDSNTQLDPGIGGYIAFDYRFHPHFSAEAGVMATIQDGTGISNGDNNILLLGMPTFDLKYYFITNSRWDPHALLGFGLYTLTEGSVDNGSMAFGVGANLGLGCDYYITEHVSLGLSGTFRAIAFIESIDGPRNGSSQFPFSMAGNFAYHF